MTNQLIRSKTAPKRALGFKSEHIANQYAIEHIKEKDQADVENEEIISVLLFDLDDPDEYETQLDTFFEATDQPRVPIWR